MSIQRLLALSINLTGLVILGCGVAKAEAHVLKLSHDMAIAGVDLRAAVYDVNWDLSGKRATVHFSHNGRVVATVQGTRATFDRSVRSDTFYVGKNSQGHAALYGLCFASTNKGIVFPIMGNRTRRPPGENSADRLLMFDGWRNSEPLPAPRVYR